MANIIGQNTRTKYGLDWPKDIHDIQIELILGKKWMLEPYKYGKIDSAPGEHWLRAIDGLFTNDEWGRHRWMEEHVHAWCEENFIVELGAASTGKSNDAGFCAVLEWICDPLHTYIALASTSVDMLKIRSFESVTRAFRTLKRNPQFYIPGKEAPSLKAIINENDDINNDATIKASIRGVALQDGGSESKAVARLAGAHMPFVTLILDEGSALPPAAAKARINARMGAKRFRFLSLANPTSFNDEATRFCEPLDGWGSVDEHTPQWRSRYGLVLHHNGYDSPAVVEEGGAEKYPYLINKDQIETTIREEGHGNADSAVVWTMVHGYPTPIGLSNTVLSPADITTFHMTDQPAWAESYAGSLIPVAGLDPAFTSGGDNCMLQMALVGYLKGGVYAIAFLPPTYIPISASSGVPASYQIVNEARAVLTMHGVPLKNVAIDDSGTQSIADVYQHETGVVPIRCNFAAKATEEISPTGQPAQARYKNLVTEMWSFVADLGRNDQIRGLDPVAGQQFCSRMYKKGIIPLALESKGDFKKRLTGRSSPDESDAVALACRAAKLHCGLAPGRDRDAGISVGGFEPTVIIPQVTLSTFYKKSVDFSAMKSYRSGKY
jgi:hypothetical protein